MTAKLTLSNGKRPRRGQNDERIAALAHMLCEGEEARLIVNRRGEVIGENSAGGPITDALEALTQGERQRLRTWLASEEAIRFETRLTVEGQLSSWIFHRIDITPAPPERLYLLIARQPSLSNNLIQALSQSRALYKDIVSTVPGMVWEIGPDCRFAFVSGANILGIDSANLVNQDPAHCFGIDRSSALQVFASESSHSSIDLWVNVEGGRQHCLSVSAKPIFDPNGHWVGARGIALNVTAERAEGDALEVATQRLEEAANTDILTGLFNRRGFIDRLSRVSQQLRPTDAGGYFAMIDLDKFKQLNDTLGHQKGDDALKAVGDLIGRNIRRADFAGRLGGDEFAVWLENSDRQGAERICQNLLKAIPDLRAQLELGDINLNMSIGMTALRVGHDVADVMMARADEALYAVKRSGRGNFIFAEDMPEDIDETSGDA